MKRSSKLRGALHKRSHVQSYQKRPRLFHQRTGALMVVLAVSGCQHACIIQIRTPKLWQGLKAHGSLEGCLEMHFRDVPPAVEGCGDS